jgi:hypothetical protein
MSHSLVMWNLDSAVNPNGDSTAEYYAMRMAEYTWARYQAQDSFPPCYVPGNPAGGINPSLGILPHEWNYEIGTQASGICGNTSGTLGLPTGNQAVYDLWSIYGNTWPVFAYFYQKTGNGIIRGSNPATHYGDAYQSMFTWGAPYSWQSGPYIPAVGLVKTLGELGIWQWDALSWMKGTTTPTPLSITTTSLPTGVVGNAYSAQLTANGGTPPYMWAITGLPMGLSLNTSTGQITGTPAVATTGNVGVVVTDSASPSNTATTSLALSISSAPVFSGLPGVIYPIP